jgi:hypothetical protein
MSNKAIEEFEGFFALVVFGKFKNLAQLRDYAINFCDVKLVFDKTSPAKLFITDTDPRPHATGTFSQSRTRDKSKLKEVNEYAKSV